MSKIKNLALGLIVATFAFGFSAFTNYQKLNVGDVYGNKPTDNDYEKLIDPYNSLNCMDTSENPCIYTVTPEGAPFVTEDNYTHDELEALRLSGYVIASTELGLYNGN